MRWALLAVALAGVQAARADLVLFRFEGVISEVRGAVTPPAGVGVGSAFRYEYVFDTLAADVDAAPNFGRYLGMVSASVMVGTFSRGEGAGEITVLDNGFAGDTYTGMSVHPLGYSQVSLGDLHGSVFEGDAQPSDLVLSAFELRSFVMRVEAGPAYWEVAGRVDGFTREVVPSPGAWVMLGMLGVVGGRGRKRQGPGMSPGASQGTVNSRVAD